ncbi:MAG: UbiA family prenyltransferase [Deltaproteobacteria bacterium]|nr:UbiA family prenyltransferase [Deltaproteobacteria bacterium]
MDTTISTEAEGPPQKNGDAGASIPLAIDLDGTLIRTDSLIESLMRLFKSSPMSGFSMLAWLAGGRARLKQEVARRVTLDVSSLPYNIEVLTFLRDQHHDNRPLVLATGADAHIARQIADYLQIFDRVLASDGTTNLAGTAKRERLATEFGIGGFDYLGNGRPDLPVWQAARRAMVVGSPAFVDRLRARLPNLDRVFAVEAADWRTWLRPLRMYQWLKNMLVFVPLLGAQHFDAIGPFLSAGVAFLAFGLCASSVYILNDLLDLPDDRRHPRKRRRPFASGKLPLGAGLAMAPLLLGLSIAVGWSALPRAFLAVLGIYYALTLAYSLRLKQIVILDVIVLAALFTVRMMAGSAAVSIWPSAWLLAFSMFLFISLALVKRYAELATMRLEHGPNARARGYEVSDAELLASMGVASAFVAILVLVLYITSGAAHLHYGRHQAIWLVCPFLLYWLCNIWLVAHRGSMHDDPLVFALKDRVSRFVMGAMVITMLLAI